MLEVEPSGWPRPRQVAKTGETYIVSPRSTLFPSEYIKKNTHQMCNSIQNGSTQTACKSFLTQNLVGHTCGNADIDLLLTTFRI